ncbi:NAD(P)-binding protein [Penicillium soppii]|uniref:NAD(P)-binding protein n=1 Tax=Penicillium soppii TaxID=69789 RepID=UPI0025477ECF|nr:NAD(P)-binding protein [Penicillium soppii]KAJ5861940.1 NAD(P)-binding protein [Penicillium soppii]
MSPKIAVVIGAARGIGRELVRQLSADSSMQIIATVRQPIDFGAPNVSSIILDQAIPSSITQAASQIPEIDTLIINGAFGDKDKMLGCPDERFDKYLDINVKGPLRIIKAFLPAILVRETRQIVLTSSLCGSLQKQSEFDHGSLGPYSLTKAAGNMMMIQLHHELLDKQAGSQLIWGGPGGMPVETSVAGYVKVIKELKLAEHPQFIAWDGSIVPW